MERKETNLTKIQRVILEQAYVNVLVCPIQQGDSWGNIQEENAQKLFDELGKDVRALQTMTDGELIMTVYEQGPDEYWGGDDGGRDEDKEELAKTPKFETFNELAKYVRENVDCGDLESIAILAIAYLQAKQ